MSTTKLNSHDVKKIFKVQTGLLVRSFDKFWKRDFIKKNTLALKGLTKVQNFIVFLTYP